MRIILFLISIFLGLCFLLLITDRGLLISEKKTEGYRLHCKYFSGRNTFYTSYWMSTKLLPKTEDEIRRDYCPFISKHK
jgi:hypothetical protein